MSCPHPSGNGVVQVKPPMLDADKNELKKLMQKKGVHALDLPVTQRPAVQGSGSGDLCQRYGVLEAALATVRAAKLDERFLLDKRQRIAAWNETQEADKKAAVQAKLADASAALVNGRFAKANQLQNAALALLFGGRELWDLPAALPETAPPSDDNRPAVVSDGEVKSECPSLLKPNTVSPDEFAGILQRLTKNMDERKVRLMDVKEGEQLAAELREAKKADALLPAARLACGLLSRVKLVEIDVGFVSKRFQVLRTLHVAENVPAQRGTRWSELVRSASEHVADKRFNEAHQVLEELLLLTGEPAQPSAALEKARPRNQGLPARSGSGM